MLQPEPPAYATRRWRRALIGVTWGHERRRGPHAHQRRERRRRPQRERNGRSGRRQPSCSSGTGSATASAIVTLGGPTGATTCGSTSRRSSATDPTGSAFRHPTTSPTHAASASSTTDHPRLPRQAQADSDSPARSAVGHEQRHAGLRPPVSAIGAAESASSPTPLHRDPLFVDPFGGDFNLQAGSPVTNYDAFPMSAPEATPSTSTAACAGSTRRATSAPLSAHLPRRRRHPMRPP